MNDIERKQKIYQEWIEEAQRIDPRKKPGEITVRDFAKSAGIGRDLGQKILEEKVQLGLVTKRITSKGIYYSLV